MHPLRRLRGDRGFSLRDLAVVTGIHYVRLHHIEHGRQSTDDELRVLARALGVPAGELQSPAAVSHE